MKEIGPAKPSQNLLEGPRRQFTDKLNIRVLKSKRRHSEGYTRQELGYADLLYSSFGSAEHAGTRRRGKPSRTKGTNKRVDCRKVIPKTADIETTCCGPTGSNMTGRKETLDRAAKYHGRSTPGPAPSQPLRDVVPQSVGKISRSLSSSKPDSDAKTRMVRRRSEIVDIPYQLAISLNC